MVIELLQAGIRTAYRTLGAQELTYETDEAKLHGFCFEGGHPRTLVLLHGLGDASTTWVRAIGELRDQFNLLALDLPPFGLSELKGGPYLTPRQQARLVEAAIGELVDGPVELVGQSLGGWVAAWLLHQAPDVAERAVLISPGGAPLPGSLDGLSLLLPENGEEVLELWRAMWYRPPALAKVIPRAALRRFQRPAFHAFVSSLQASALPAALQPEVGRRPEELGEQALAALRERELLVPDVLAGIHTPALVIWGHQDGLLDGATPGYLARHWGGRLEVTYLARCAHLPHLERGQAVVDRMRSFLA